MLFTMRSGLRVALPLTACALISSAIFSCATAGEDYARLAAARSKANHPLQPVLRWAVAGHERIRREIRDYTCLMVKRERVDGELGEYQFIQAKVRHRRRGSSSDRMVPFSVYLRFLAPSRLKNREVLYVEGQNNGRLIARKGGSRFPFVTTSVEPTSRLAMQGNRYPITEFGFENLVRRLIEVAQEEIAIEGSDVQYYKNAKVDGRECIGVAVRQTRKREDSRFYMARVYIDRRLQVPIHYEAYGWPEEEGEKPPLLEQYTYRDIKLNVGLRDRDFQRNNPKYGFRD